MAKKHPKTVVNNIDSVNIEIDYDKLAQAIVKAKKSAKEQNIKEKQNIGFIKTIIMIITNKGDTHDKMTIGAFTFLLELFFRAISLFLFAVTAIYSGIGIYRSVQNFISMEQYGVIEMLFKIILIIAVGFLVSLFCILLWGTGNEVGKEKDKNYIMSVFSGVIGWAALIVSIIALVKGVG